VEEKFALNSAAILGKV